MNINKILNNIFTLLGFTLSSENFYTKGSWTVHVQPEIKPFYCGFIADFDEKRGTALKHFTSLKDLIKEVFRLEKEGLKAPYEPCPF